MAVVVRFELGGTITQRVVSLKMLAKPVDAEELAQHLMEVLAIEYGISGSKILSITNDRCSVNLAALDNLKTYAGKAIRIPCFSHTLSNCGKKVNAPAVKLFMTKWNTFTSKSMKASLAWSGLTGEPLKKSSETRWFSEYEQYVQLWNHREQVPLYLDNLVQGKICAKGATAAKHRLNNNFWLELSAIIDVFGKFCGACYNLEGDGFLAPHVYDQIIALQHHVDACNFMRLNFMANKLTGPQGTPEAIAQRKGELFGVGQQAVAPGIAYFKSKFLDADAPLSDAMKVFRSARIFNPLRIRDFNANEILQAAKGLPFVDPPELKRMAEELSTYTSIAASVSTTTVDLEEFWAAKSSSLPAWSRVAFQVGLIQPSSACVERVFSILRAHFNKRQNHARQDLVEGSIKLSYNERQRVPKDKKRKKRLHARAAPIAFPDEVPVPAAAPAAGADDVSSDDDFDEL
jgi:hypothetical protein